MPPTRAPRTRRPGYCARGKARKPTGIHGPCLDGKPPRAGGLPDYPGDGDSGAGYRPVLVAFIPKETYDTGDCVAALRRRGVSLKPEHQWPVQRRRTTRHPGYAISQRIRRVMNGGRVRRTPPDRSGGVPGSYGLHLVRMANYWMAKEAPEAQAA